jgi:tRNA pseudouridine38-40 synthase
MSSQCLIFKLCNTSDRNRLLIFFIKNLPISIKILAISKVEDSFHSRFHAKKRTYRYLITSKQTNPFNAKYITYVKNIDEELLKKAIKEFIGVYDFKYFHKTGSDKEITVREIFHTCFYKYKDVYVFKFTANSYLRSQIRLMVGFLLAINDKKQTIEKLKEQLKTEKHNFKLPAIANGLYLAKVQY